MSSPEAQELNRLRTATVVAALVVAVPYLGFGLRYGAGLASLAPFALAPALAIAAALRRPEERSRSWLLWPVAMWPLLYTSACRIMQLEPGRYVDTLYRSLDTRILGSAGPPPWPLGGPMEELANLFYVSYYAAIPVGLYLAWRWAGEEGALRYGLAILSTFAACALLWLALPGGGYHPDGYPHSAPYGPFTHIAHTMYAADPHFAAAFPSSHVALSAAAVGVLRRLGLGAGAWLWVAGVAFATAYGQYHYLVDAPAGLIVGLLGSAVGVMPYGQTAPQLNAALSRIRCDD